MRANLYTHLLFPPRLRQILVASVPPIRLNILLFAHTVVIYQFITFNQPGLPSTLDGSYNQETLDLVHLYQLHERQTPKISKLELVNLSFT